MCKVAIVTPLKNEMENIDRLIKSIEKQTMPIDTWIIVENGSSDGSRERLAQINRLEGINNFIVCNFMLPNERYELGEKYATVVNYGFQEIFKRFGAEHFDYIGILDADCFPENNYYEKLVSFMEKDDRLGICSGLNYLLDGTHNGESPSWVTGNCRLWKSACFKESGYLIGPSADTLSVCKALIKKWKVYPNPDIKYYSRDMGVKVNFEYYGYSAYYRGIGPFYALLKSLNFIRQKKFDVSQCYFKGYFKSYFARAPRVQDVEILRYYKSYLFKKILEIPSYVKGAR